MPCALAALLLGGAAHTALADNPCPSAAGPVALSNAQWNGWGRGLDNTRYQPEPALRASDVAKLAVKWAYGYQSGTEFGQPTIVDERLFVASSTGRVYSLDAKTGCIYWTFGAGGGVRSQLTRYVEVDLEGVARFNRFPTGGNSPGSGVSPLYGGAFYWRVLTRF